MDHIRRDAPYHPSYDVIARAYKNASGIDEMIYLHRVCWDHVDWLEANTDINFADWVVHCANNPAPDFTLSHLLQYWLWVDECNRHRNGELPLGRKAPYNFDHSFV